MGRYLVTLVQAMTLLLLLNLIFAPLFVISLTPGEPEYKTVVFSDPEHGDVERSYIQYVPSGYDSQTAVPLLLDFHGWTSSAQSQMETGTTGGCTSATTVAPTATHTPLARAATPATMILPSLSIWS